MSQKNKQHTGLNSNRTIREAIQKIALHGFVNPVTGVVRDTNKVTGYVAKIHESGPLAGTIDVQEYTTLAMSDNGDVKIGYHEGVYLSSIQDNSNGLVIVPKLYSEVTIMVDPETHTEYVTMFSHVDIIQLDSHKTVTIGVREREEYDANDEDAPLVQDLEDTGVFSKTTYLKDSIVAEVQGEDDENYTRCLMDDEKIEVVAGDNKSSTLLNKEEIHLQHDKSEVILDDNQGTLKCGNSIVKVEDGTVHIGSDSSTDFAVLGGELVSLLSDLVGYIGQIMTPTMIGPQPPANIASFIAMKAKIEAMKAGTGILTQKVKIQK